MDHNEFQDRLRSARERTGAIILAHNYQPGWIQDIADYLGDSLYLAQVAAEHDAPVLVFCGVEFMAESAKLLSPEKTVLLPATDAGCSLAESISVEDLEKWKAEYPDAIVAVYVNTSAAVKAMADICVTSSNAVQIVSEMPRDQDVLFAPDFFLGSWVREQTQHPKLHVWMGECHVHAGMSPGSLTKTLREDPDATVYVHPECGCTTPSLYEIGSIARSPRVKVLSTGQMVSDAMNVGSGRVVVATEVGILHQLRKTNSEAKFEALNPDAVCPYMNRVTPESLLASLESGVGEVTLPVEVAVGARQTLAAMLDPSLRPWLSRV